MDIKVKFLEASDGAKGKSKMTDEPKKVHIRKVKTVINIAKIVHCVGVLGMGEDGAIVRNLHNTIDALSS